MIDTTFHEAKQGDTSIKDSRTGDTPFVAFHDSFLDLLGPDPRVQVLARGTPGFAHEAGIWVEATQEVWFTSNLQKRSDSLDANGLIEYSVDISKIGIPSGKVERVKINDACHAGNGGCSFGDYVLLCDQGKGTAHLSQLVLVDPEDPSITLPILNNLQGRPLNSLNDVIVLPPPPHFASTSRASSSRTPYPSLRKRLPPYGSTVWFTDPPYGSEQKLKPAPQLPPQVYCFDPYSGNLRCVADGLAHPNGIAFSPDGATCYITDTSHIHGSGVLDPSLASTM